MNIRVTKRQKNNGLSVTDNFNNPGLDLIEELDGTFTIVGGNGEYYDVLPKLPNNKAFVRFKNIKELEEWALLNTL